MADAIYLVRRTNQGVNDDRNLVRDVLIFNDNGDNEATVIANTIVALNTANPVEAGVDDVYPAGYFQSATAVGLTPSAFFTSEFDFLAFTPAVSELSSA
jgi:hypothetical protein